MRPQVRDMEMEEMRRGRQTDSKGPPVNLALEGWRLEAPESPWTSLLKGCMAPSPHSLL